MLRCRPTTTPSDTEPREETEVELEPEDEAELDRLIEASLEDERQGRLIPHEAVFPRRRMTG